MSMWVVCISLEIELACFMPASPRQTEPHASASALVPSVHASAPIALRERNIFFMLTNMGPMTAASKHCALWGEFELSKK